MALPEVTVPTVLAWEDDPGEPPSDRMPIHRPVPDLDTPPLPTAIAGRAPAPDGGMPGSAAFRYWTAADALSRGSAVWGPLMPPGTTWHRTVGPKLTVRLDEGEDLNAYYDRRSLSFFHTTVAGVEVYSGESAEVVAHELGHAVLDALRPQLWNVASAEAEALHESFGDISALLAALRLESVRSAVLAETRGFVEASSRASRIAEQLGWALRQRNANGVDANALREASNRHFYRDPVHLPPSAPATELSSEPHSFSRVFTGAFLKIIAGIFQQQPVRDSEALARAAGISAVLLADAVLAAPVVTGYYAQLAAHMIAADQELHGGEHGQALRSAFVRHGIISLAGATSLTGEALREHGRGIAESGGPGPAAGEELSDLTIPGDVYGLVDGVAVTMPTEQTRFAVAGSDPAGGALEPAGPRQAAMAYIEDLFRRSRIGVNEELRAETSVVADDRRTRTHEIVRTDRGDGLQLLRRRFAARPARATVP
ncbi:hypothetical protein [Streptomyces aidingensis]|uniref:Uncharacterized protein n=1 Tax=Streptomyces aidingensis TaxID=910347 RepID=A0A1I1PDN6_9ACTN|nr:hypothetical protein [Streptomyces aidingensis]SFD07806.1 hypothetical protein SAMN05421773_109118 [Streptomyces aidingensis]